MNFTATTKKQQQKNVLSHAMTKAVSFAQSKLKTLKAVYSKSMSPTSQKKTCRNHNINSRTYRSRSGGVPSTRRMTR